MTPFGGTPATSMPAEDKKPIEDDKKPIETKPITAPTMSTEPDQPSEPTTTMINTSDSNINNDTTLNESLYRSAMENTLD